LQAINLAKRPGERTCASTVQRTRTCGARRCQRGFQTLCCGRYYTTALAILPASTYDLEKRLNFVAQDPAVLKRSAAPYGNNRTKQSVELREVPKEIGKLPPVPFRETPLKVNAMSEMDFATVV
jgi:hypothetical protein